MSDKPVMDIAPFVIAPARLWDQSAPPDLPIAFVDLDTDTPWPDTWSAPPCPLVGLGDRSHPHAAALDAVIEPPVSAAGIAALVARQSLAAQAFIALMRMHAGHGVARAAMLDAESLAYAALQGSAAHRDWIAKMGPRDAGSEGTVRVERSHDILHVTLDRPTAGNAIDRAMRDALHEAFSLAADDPEIARIVVRAVGRSFSLGADLAEFGTISDPALAHAIRARTLPARALARFRGLVDCHVQGACVGAGLEIAAFASWITASRDAWFHLPELAMGILPGAGGCWSLPRRIGRQRTALMVLSGRRIPARIAHQWGLVDALVDDPV